MTRFFGALLHFGFASPQFIIWKWLDILVRCCTSVSLLHSLSFGNEKIFSCVAALRFRFSTVCHFKMTRIFGALLHFVFRFSTVCHLKMTRFFGALLHFGFACPQFVFSKWLDFAALLHFGFASTQFVIWKWLDILVRCCTSVSLPHCLSFEND